MVEIYLQEPTLDNQDNFIRTMHLSQHIHHPWLQAPSTPEEYRKYLEKYQASTTNKSYLVFAKDNPEQILGVINLNEIIRGCFHNAFLAYYASCYGVGKGVMLQALKLVIDQAFNQLNLHRIEANIQPTNVKSIQFIQRAGFRNEGMAHSYLFIDGVWQDHLRFALLNHDWQVVGYDEAKINLRYGK